MGFRENLKDEISYQGIMIKELAAKSGVQAGSISNYLKENCSIPSADVAVKLATALNVTVEYLVNGKKNEKSLNLQNAPKQYPLEIRRLADKIETLCERDIKNISALVDAMCDS